jgi:hypothetical protein
MCPKRERTAIPLDKYVNTDLGVGVRLFKMTVVKGIMLKE